MVAKPLLIFANTMSLSSARLAQLVKNSRLAQVPRNDMPLVQAGPRYHPTHQIIETKPAALERQEWGLKSSIPSKVKSRYLIYNDLDTLERITTFEPNGGTQWNRLRFQEMGLAPKYNPGKANPLFEGSSSHADQLAPLSSFLNITSGNATSQKDVQTKLPAIKALRSQFKQWLVMKDPEALRTKGFTPKDLHDLAVQFLAEEGFGRKADTTRRMNKSTMQKVVGTGGLTYNLPGKLRNSPNGVVSKTIVPGRFLNVDGNDRLAAIGGFVANASSSSPMTSQVDYNMGDFVRELIFPFEVQQAAVEDNGKVILKARVVSGLSPRAKLQMSGRNYQQRPLKVGGRYPAVRAEDSTKHAEELLSILTNFDK